MIWICHWFSDPEISIFASSATTFGLCCVPTMIREAVEILNSAPNPPVMIHLDRRQRMFCLMESWTWNKENWALIPTLPFTNDVVFGKSSLALLQFSRLKYEVVELHSVLKNFPATTMVCVFAEPIKRLGVLETQTSTRWTKSCSLGVHIPVWGQRSTERVRRHLVCQMPWGRGESTVGKGHRRNRRVLGS